MSNPETAIGIDFGGTSIKSGVISAGKIVHKASPIETAHFQDSNLLIDELVRRIEEMKAAFPAVAGVGIGLPGFVDSVNGIVHKLTNVPGWTEIPLTKIIEERTGLPAIIENDANAMAYAEFLYGAARGSRHAVCITLGTGVGGGLILDGRLFRGAQLAAGEPGHMSIDYQGKVGPYGNYGGLEEYVGNQQIAERAVQMYRENGISKSEDDCTPAILDQSAREGDPIARGLWDTLGDEIGACLANIVWLLNPDCIVIGGGVSKAGELLLVPIRRSLKSRTIKLLNQNLKVVIAEMGNDAGMMGCAGLVLEKVSQLPQK